MAVATIAVASGIFLLLGYLTPLASVLAALASFVIALAPFPSPGPDVDAVRLSSGFSAVISVALLCLGPGALSIDAQRYGQREIIIPQRPRPSSEK